MSDYTRLIIKDEEGKSYRICNFRNSEDKYGEKYLKISFPDLGKKMHYFEKIAGKKEDEVEPETMMRSKKKGVTEYSFHYQGNATHFKIGGARELERKDTPTLDSQDALHVITVFVYDLNHFVPFEKDLTEHDLVLSEVFTKGRRLQFYASKKKVHVGMNSYESDDSRFINGYVFSSNNDDLKITIFDEEFLETPKNRSGVSLYRMYDPTSGFK